MNDKTTTRLALLAGIGVVAFVLYRRYGASALGVLPMLPALPALPALKAAAPMLGALEQQREAEKQSQIALYLSGSPSYSGW